MVKVKKKSKLKKLGNVNQNVIVNVQPPAKLRSKNTKSFNNNGFFKFQSNARVMTELSSMPNKIREIISQRQNETNSNYERQLKDLMANQEFMKRQISARIEKQTLDKYLQNIANNFGNTKPVSLKDLKSGIADFDSGIPIP